MTRQELMMVGLVALGALAAILFVLSSGQIAENARLQENIDTVQQDAERVRARATEIAVTADGIASEVAQQLVLQATDIRATTISLDTEMQEREEGARALVAEAQADATTVRATADAGIEAAETELAQVRATANARATRAQATLSALQESAEQDATAARETISAVHEAAEEQSEFASATIGALQADARADADAARGTIDALEVLASTVSAGATIAAGDAATARSDAEQRLATAEAQARSTTTSTPTLEPSPTARQTEALQAATPTRTPPPDEGVALGQVVTARSLDSSGCPRQVTRSFSTTEDVIYVVAEDSNIPEGTWVYVRWLLDGVPYEDAEEIVADQDYEDICVSFSLELDEASEFRPGDYRAEFIVNGEAAESTTFTIEDES